MIFLYDYEFFDVTFNGHCKLAFVPATGKKMQFL